MVNSVLRPLIDVDHEGTVWNQWRNGGVGSGSVDQSSYQRRLLALLEEPHGDALLTQQR